MTPTPPSPAGPDASSSVVVECALGSTTIRLSTGHIARRAAGAVLLEEGETVLLATVAVGAAAPDKDFLPLTVNFRQRRSAVGRIPGNYFRRETRPDEVETLTSRLIDRSLRPLFAPALRRQIQIDVTLLSATAGSDFAGLAIIAASAAVQQSTLPFAGPVAGLRLVQQDGGTRWPAPEPAPGTAAIELVLAATPEGLVMLEGGAAAVDAATLHGHIAEACGALEPVWAALERLAARRRRPIAPPAARPAPPTALPAATNAAISAALAHPDALSRLAALAELKNTSGGDRAAVERAIAVAKAHRVERGERLDGRPDDTIRPISCSTRLLPGCHGSALFTRGETQALVSVTLGGAREGRDHDRLFGHQAERFMLHYNFPGFAVGAPGGGWSPSRRELGHGRLAHRALAPMMPPRAEWPFTVRVVSDILSADGSSSMATVCGATLALTAAGVPLDAPVAGVALGAIEVGERWRVLSDITGDEDHMGLMDLKVAGPRHGITALQLDTKSQPLSFDRLADALARADRDRAHILDAMAPALEALATSPDPHPRHALLRVNSRRVGQVIGSGGRNLNQIQSKTGARLEVGKEGLVLVMGPTPEIVDAGRRAVEAISIELRTDGLYQGQIKSVRDYGAFVRIAEHEGLVHVSEWGEGNHRQAKGGDMVMVRVLGADERGRLRLSRRAAAGSSPDEAINA